MVKNEGQLEKYHVIDSHPAIVTPIVFELVQAEINKNSASDKKRSSVSCFSGKIVCPICGALYGRKTWRTTEGGKKASRQVWQCGDKYKERGKSCPSTHVSEDELELAFISAFNEITADRDRYTSALEPILEALGDTTDLENMETILNERAAGIYAKMDDMVRDNARRVIDQAEYNRKYSELTERYNAVKLDILNIASEKDSRLAKRHDIQRFIDAVRERETLLARFDEPLFRATVDKITVHSAKDVAIKFRDGQEVHVDARLKKYA